MSVSTSDPCTTATGSASFVEKGGNRLAGESSRYLLQHARNPVDWFPWSDEAIRRAREGNKPIFLSIGYSACHWCHVMERESFEDQETARILNENFIAIKVDREEHPELDEIYMAVVQLMIGNGGWPLNVFLTPNLEPFFGGTYYPPTDRHGLPGFKTVLLSMADLWREEPDRIQRIAGELARALRSHTGRKTHGGEPLDASLLSRAVAELKWQFDPIWGGFGGPPNFPDTGAIALLLQQRARTGHDDLLKMASTTLDHMAYGGIHDQIGGGFHRYSVDGHWLMPHFEKMLYDNALLAKSYLDAWQATGTELYRRVATDTLDWTLRDMADPGGGFHASQDADSEGREGAYYLWRPDEIDAALGVEDGRFFRQFYGVTEQGNFEGRNILYVPHDPASYAQNHGLTEMQLYGSLTPLRAKLLEARNRRTPPGKDTKILTAWNGMMISALARGFQSLGEHRYLEAARRAANFVLGEMVHEGKLLRTHRNCGEGASRLPGYLDDYAELAASLVDLYEANFEYRWLATADWLVREMLGDFWDESNGAFYYTSAAHEHLLVRTKPSNDGPTPSGNATAAMVLLRLSKLLDNRDYFAKAERLLMEMSHGLRTQPRAHLNLLGALDFYLGILG